MPDEPKTQRANLALVKPKSSALKIAGEPTRAEELHRKRLDRLLRDAAKVVELRKYAFLDDASLCAKGLTEQQIRIVRAYEAPRSEAPFAIESADAQVRESTKREAADGGITLNVENMTLNLPEKREPERRAVVIDVDATK